MKTIARVAALAALALAVLTLATSPAAALNFFTVTPCRVYDSRGTDGPLDMGQTFTAQTGTDGIPVAGVCGVLADAVAAAFNVTIVGATESGNLVVFPAGEAPPTIGALSFSAGLTRSMLGIVELGDNGACTGCVDALATVTPPTNPGPDQYQLILDVTGYFLASAPVLDGAGTVTFTEDGGPITVAPAITVTDPDDTNLQSATVTIANPQNGASEVLAATSCGGLTVTPGLNNLSITGNEPLATYETCLQSVTYDNTAQNVDTTARSVDFVVNDGTSNSNTETATVNITNINDAPEGTDGSVGTSQGTDYVFAAADFGFTDPNDTPPNALLAVKITTLPAAGSLTLSGNPVVAGQFIAVTDITAGNLKFTPSGTTSTSFTFQVQDDGGTSGGGVDLDPTPNTLDINVNNINDAPEGTDNTVDTNEDTDYTFAAADFGFTDPNDTPPNNFLAVTITTLPAVGVLELSNVAVTAGQSIPVGDIPNLTFTPVADEFGSSYTSFTFQVQDDGGTTGGGVDLDQSANTMTIDVLPVNEEPTLDPIGDPADINEDAGLQTVNLTGIGAGDGAPESGQTLTVTATSSNPGLIPDPTVTYTSPNATGSLSYTPVANQSGTAIITVTVQDSGGTANGGDDTIQRTFTVDVLAVNDEPTLDPIPDPADINENAGLQTVNLTGISAGPGESQVLTVTATSDNPGLIPDPTVTYTSPNATGSLSYTPVAGQSGSAVITVTVMDDGGTANGGDDTIQRTFTVDVLPVNDEPTLDPISDPADILEDAGLQTVNLTGIGAGDGAAESGQTLTVTATSSNPGLIPNPTVTYTSPNATGSLSYTPVANQFGSAIITVTVQDDGGTANGGDDTIQRTFTVDVLAVNDEPTLDAIPDPADINEDAGLQTVNLTGISAGPGESQTLTVTATSSNTGLIPHPTVTYTSPNATGSLSYTPVANQFGSAIITVTVQDSGGTANGGDDTIQRTFTVDVLPVNDAPTADNDSFDYIGNTQLEVDQDTAATPEALETTPSTFGVLDGDADPVEGDDIAVSAITVGACTDNTLPTFDCTDAAVGTVHMQPNGRFSFEPAAGDTGAAPTTGCTGTDQETFQYTVTDDGTPTPASTIATVRLCRFARVWYVDNSAGSDGSGTSTSPMNAIDGDLNGPGGGGDLDSTGDYIFVDFGNGTNSGQAAGIALENNQHLLGEFAGLSIPVNLNSNGSPTVLKAVPGLTDCSGGPCRPVIGNAAGNAVSATDVIPIEIFGLSLSGSANAIDWTTAAAFGGTGTLTIRDNVVTGAGAEGVDILLQGTGATNLAFHDNTLTATGTALDIAETGTSTLTITTFHDNVVTGNSAGAGINIVTATFDTTAGLPITAVTGGQTVIGDAGNRIGGAGLTLTNVTGALNFANSASGTILAGDLDIYTDSGAALSVSGVGGFDLDVTPNAGVLVSNAGPAADILGADVDLQLSSLTSTNSASTGVSLTTVTGTFSAPSGSSISTAGTTDFVIASSSAAVTYGGTITDDVGQLVSVSNSGGSLKHFKGAITDGDDGDGGGISLTSNSSTIRFSGGLVLDTGSVTAFNASGGGTVEICDEEPCNPGAAGGLVNKIETTSGTALNVSNTNIGSNNLEFLSISAGTGTNSSGVGISLDTTGTAAGNGGLVVRGTGTAGSGGTIQHKTGADGSLTAGIGIYLKATKAASFSRMQLNDFGNFAIRGNEINGLTLADVVVSGLNGTNASFDEGSIYLEDAGGTIAVSSSNIAGGFQDNLFVFYDNATAGPAATYNITGTTFRDLQAGGQNAQVNLLTSTAASSSWDVDFNFTSSCVFENDANTQPPGGTENFSDGILVTFGGPFSHLLNVRNATFHHLFQAMDMASDFSADVTYQIKDNDITFTEGVAAIALGSGSTSTASSLLTGVIQGNDIGDSGIPQSGNRLGLGIALDMRGNEIAQFTVHGNTIRRTEVNGIQVIGQTAADGNLDIQITNNVIQEIEDDGGLGAGVIYGLEVTTNAGTSHDICLDARNNDSFNINAQDIRVRQSNAAVTFAIEGLTGSGASDVNVENYLISQNPGNTADVRTGGSIVNYTSVVSCTTPSTL